MSVNTSQTQNSQPTFNKISLSISAIVLIVFLPTILNKEIPKEF